MFKDFKKLLNEYGEGTLLGCEGCCCGDLELFGIKVETHCWKSGKSGCKHEYSCVHIFGEGYTEKKELTEIGKMFKQAISEHWMTECALEVKI